MKVIVTTMLCGTRFYLTPDNYASDIQERAATFKHSHDAQMIADTQTREPGFKLVGIKWHVAHLLSNGTIAEQGESNESVFDREPIAEGDHRYYRC